MDVQELKKKLVSIGVPARFYSINGSCLANTYVLRQIYNYWEFSYIDERGNPNGIRQFAEENEACIYMLAVLKEEMGL